MKRTLVSTVAGLLLVTVGAGAANATEAPPEPAPYIVAVWKFDTKVAVLPGDQAPYPQTLIESRLTDSSDVKSVPVPNTCGQGFQIDLYANDARTVEVILKGKLEGWRTDGESWPGGKYRPDFSKVVFNPDCPPMPAGYDVPTVIGGDLECGDGWYEDIVRIDTYAHKLVDNQWVPYVASTREERQNNRPVTEEECPPIEPTPEPLSTLPETGPAEDIAWGMFWLALLTVAAGLSFWLAGSTKSDRYHKRDVK